MEHQKRILRLQEINKLVRHLYEYILQENTDDMDLSINLINKKIKDYVNEIKGKKDDKK